MNKIWRKMTSLKNVPDFNEQADELKELAENKGYRYHRKGKAGEYDLRDEKNNVVLSKVSLTDIYNHLRSIY